MDVLNEKTGPRLLILSGASNRGWLRYILDEFKRIQGADFEITLESLGYNISGERVLYHSSNEHEGFPTIPAHSEVNRFSASEAEKVLKSDQIEKDLLRMAFIAISRLEEYVSELNGKHIKSYRSRHSDKNLLRFKKPYVNLLFKKLELLITNHYPELRFKTGARPIVELTHDLDYIEKTTQLRLKQGAFQTYNTLRSIVHPSSFLGNAQKAFRFPVSNPSYWCFDYWIELEKSHDCRSTFFLFSDTAQTGVRSWLMDPSYNIHENLKLKDKVKSMMADGFEFGLHGSYKSATSPNLLVQEKTTLEETIGSDIKKTRQHWLNFEEQVTPAAHSKIFEMDSSLAWNDDIGFRAGCASLFHPFDHAEQKAFKHIELPQVIMDSNIYDYSLGQVAKMEEARILLEGLKDIKNSHVAISWHTRVCNSDYNWQSGYEELVKATR